MKTQGWREVMYQVREEPEMMCPFISVENTGGTIKDESENRY